MIFRVLSSFNFNVGLFVDVSDKADVFIFALFTRQSELLTMRLWGNQETFIPAGITQQVFFRHGEDLRSSILASLVCEEMVEPVLACSWDRAKKFQQWSPFHSFTLYILWCAFHWCVFQTEVRKGVTVERFNSLVYMHTGVRLQKGVVWMKIHNKGSACPGVCVFYSLYITHSYAQDENCVFGWVLLRLLSNRDNTNSQWSSGKHTQVGTTWRALEEVGSSSPHPRWCWQCAEGKPGLKEKCWEPPNTPAIYYPVRSKLHMNRKAKTSSSSHSM